MDENKENLNQANEEVKEVAQESAKEIKENTNQVAQDVKEEISKVEENVKEEISEVKEEAKKVEEKAKEIQVKKAEVQKKADEVNVQTKREISPKNKKLITYGIIGGACLLALIIAVVAIIALTGKPSKSTAKQIVTSYIDAINDKDEEKYLKLIDTEGSVIFKEEGEKKFDQKYKNKKKYIKDYLEDNDYDDLDELKDDLGQSFKNTYKYTSTEYTFKEIASVEKSSKSKKLCIVRAKVRVKTSYGSDTQTFKFYVMKVSGKYKVVGVERV